ncbi:undecaprenyl-diphosphatase [Natranaerovirga hydrolytica]|uniref:Undecaprenyl-diphosphatase n=1 Tax=Natranaerovirga hydrolytica TaxID=680378 RepID=A0A4R1N5D0_9FIRM|nr:phosphatase PAP2 family protein [Natranaerovirga hydrolytica]TCK98189.1 undecaprenyl-diphosphatase [Natranaerovirga hydrolytica]
MVFDLILNKGMMNLNIDVRLFDFLFGISSEYTFVGHTMLWITEISSMLFAGIYVVAIIKLLLDKDKRIIPLIIGPAFALFTVQLIRYFYVRPRPFVAMELESLLSHSANGSFPSQHAVSAFVIATVVLCCFYPVGKLVIALAILTALSRVMVGVHYPLDVMMGAFIGIAIGWMSFYLFNQYIRKKQESL